MKHANIILAKMASLVGTEAEHNESFPRTWLDMRLCGEVTGRSPYIRIDVEVVDDDPSRPAVYSGHGHTVDTAYAGVEDDIEERWRVSRVTVSVLTPSDASVDYTPVYSLPLVDPVGWSELRRRSGGPVTGEALLQAVYQLYREGQGYVPLDVVDVGAINRRAHASQMWVSRHYGRPA